MLNRPDSTGLYPIHWASIHNRADLIDYMIAMGSQVRVSCSNKLFADGTALHLAACNGSIEAASCLLRAEKRLKSEDGLKEVFKTVSASTTTNKPSSVRGYDRSSWLEDRDFEDQTPLMRSAAPRSKRLDTVRDLLRKNLWSVSGRPAEMALFLIHKGANWRDTEGYSGMNLMHLAVANDHNDIVCLLVNIDPQIIDVPIKACQLKDLTIVREKSRPPSSEPKDSSFQAITQATSSPMQTSTTDTDTDSEVSAVRTEPLITDRARAEQIISSGLTPMQLAILFSRVSPIQSLWPFLQRRSQEHNSGELSRILLKATCSNTSEIRRFIKRNALKYAFALDLLLFGLIWIPLNMSRSDRTLGGMWGFATLLSYIAAVTITLRVINKDPGFIRKNDIKYFKELEALVTSGKQPKGEKYRIGQDSATNLDNEPKRVEKDSKEDTDQRDTLNLKGISGDVEERVRFLCHKCRCIRKPRSRHCDYCDHCVQDFDHHCIYLGCCVGRKNRLDFLVFSFLLFWLGLYGTIFRLKVRHNEQVSVGECLSLGWVIKNLIIGGLTTFFTLRRACLGVTMYESIRSARIRKIFGSRGPPKGIAESNRLYSTEKGSFWRYLPDRFRSGDLPAWRIKRNLSEFANLTFRQYLRSLLRFRDKTRYSKQKLEERDLYQLV